MDRQMKDVLTIVEHHSPHYGPRTWHNARAAEVTCALAIDFDTRGERLTARAAGARYVRAPLLGSIRDAAATLYRALPLQENRRSVNIAGNGLHSLASRRIDQTTVNQWVFDVLSLVHQYRPICALYTGGQSGVDLAGAVAGAKLGIPTCVTMPNGFLQRSANGNDVRHSEADIRKQIFDGASRLQSNADRFRSAI